MKDAYHAIKVKYTAKIQDVDFFEGQICEAEILKNDASGRWYLIKPEFATSFRKKQAKTPLI